MGVGEALLPLGGRKLYCLPVHGLALGEGLLKGETEHRGERRLGQLQAVRDGALLLSVLPPAEVLGERPLQRRHVRSPVLLASMDAHQPGADVLRPSFFHHLSKESG